MSVMDIFATMEYGPVPEAAAPALDWIKERQPFGLFINNQWVQPSSGEYLESVSPATGRLLARVAAAGSADVDAAVAAARAAFATWSETSGHVRARYLYPPGRPPFLLPCRLGAAYGLRTARLPARRRGGADHPLELPPADAGLEDRSGPGDGQYRRAQARALHAADRAQIRRDRAGDRPAAGRGQHRDRRGIAGRRGPGETSRCQQDRLYRFNRSRAQHSPRHRRIRQKALARTGRQIALHRLR